VLDWVDVASYGTLLVLTTWNIGKLIKEGKWKILYVTSFYGLAFMVAFSRIVYFVASYHYLFKNRERYGTASITS